jgi:hypothetical protein
MFRRARGIDGGVLQERWWTKFGLARGWIVDVKFQHLPLVDVKSVKECLYT